MGKDRIRSGPRPPWPSHRLHHLTPISISQNVPELYLTRISHPHHTVAGFAEQLPSRLLCPFGTSTPGAQCPQGPTKGKSIEVAIVEQVEKAQGPGLGEPGGERNGK